MLNCLYCSNSAVSMEHVLPAAFGYFKGSPMLPSRLCADCNNRRLGLLDEQLARCGPEGFFRRYYGIEGRKKHADVNLFARNSAGGKRIEVTTFDAKVGREVCIEVNNGLATQLCAISFIEKTTGKTHHIPLNPKMSAEQLRKAFEQCQIAQPFEVALSLYPHEEEWVQQLLRQVWPAATLSPETPMSDVAERPVAKFQVTGRYHRAFAKIGFHYFLSQFPRFSGHQEMFANIRQFIAEDTNDSHSRVNDFISERKTPLLSAMASGLRPPKGWRAHVIAAEIQPGICFAHVQMFLTSEWTSPIRTILLARSATFTSHEAAGHVFKYHSDGMHDGFAGEAKVLPVKVI
jgi:hypothetical protein